MTIKTWMERLPKTKAVTAFDRRFAMEDEITDLRARLAEQQQSMSNMLARIHRDGGHYEADHGTKKAIIDADVKVAEMHALLSELEQQEPVAWRLGHRLYGSLKDAEFDWRHDSVFENTGYVPEPLYAAPGAKT